MFAVGGSLLLQFYDVLLPALYLGNRSFELLRKLAHTQCHVSTPDNQEKYFLGDSLPFPHQKQGKGISMDQESIS